MSVSVRDVAALARVSVGTVSNVMNRPAKVAPETVKRVQDAIDQLGFVRNDAARQLRAGRSRSIGLIVLDVRNPFFTDLARGAEDRAAEDGFSVLLGNADETTSREAAYLDLFEEQRVYGVLITPLGDAMPRLERLRERGTPTVLVDREADHTAFSSVAVDDVAGGRLAVEHLVSLGRRSIAFVGGPESIRQVVDRLEGARQVVDGLAGAGAGGAAAAAAAGPAGGPDLDDRPVTLEVLSTESLTVDEGRRAGEAIVARAASDRPDAVFAANDLLAVGVLQALMKSQAVSVPDDIALIGYDDIAFAQTAIVPLSSIRQPAALIGYTAVELLMREAESGGTSTPKHIVFQPELVVRASTVAPPPDA